MSLNKCSNCLKIVDKTYNYCPYCSEMLNDTNIKSSKSVLNEKKQIDNIENVIKDLEEKPLISSQLNDIYKLFQLEMLKKTGDNSLLEEILKKINIKYIKAISESEYTVKDMIILSKKILLLSQLLIG